MDIQPLLTETQLAFDKSPIKEFAIKNNHKWYYSFSATQLKNNSIVLVGFNWGAAKNEDYEPQAKIPSKSFKELYDQNDLGSFQRVYKPLTKYLPGEDINNCVQTNFCFFRSQKEDQITPADIELSTPLLSKLMALIKPKAIIGFSSKLRDHFLATNLCPNIQKETFPSNKKTLLVTKGSFASEGNEIPIYFLPHPNAKFTSEAREKAWEFCFPSRTFQFLPVSSK